jgi:hypothetical protein
MRLFDLLARQPAFLDRVERVYVPTTEVEPAAIKMAALTVVGNLVGSRFVLRRPGGQVVKVGATTWNLLVAGPSGLGRKTTCADIAMSLARAASREWRLLAPEAPSKDDDADPEDVAADPRAALFTMPGGVGSSGESIVDSVSPPNVVSADVWTDVGPPSVLLALEEAGPLFAPEARRGVHHESLRRFLLEAYSGWQSGRQTKKGGTTLPGPCVVSTIGTVTSDEILACLQADAVTSGFLGRIVPVLTKPAPQERLKPFWTAPVPEAVDALVRWLVAAGTVEKWRLRFTPDAEQAWIAWYYDVNRRLGSTNGHGPKIEATLIGRYQNLAQRLAVALTIAGWEPAPWPYLPNYRDWRIAPPHDPEELAVGADVVHACTAAIEDFARGMSGLVEQAAEEADGETLYKRAVISAVGNAGGRLRLYEVGQVVRPKRFGLNSQRAQYLRDELVNEGALTIDLEHPARGPARQVLVMDAGGDES